jgi:hypothetical protein
VLTLVIEPCHFQGKNKVKGESVLMTILLKALLQIRPLTQIKECTNCSSYDDDEAESEQFSICLCITDEST